MKHVTLMARFIIFWIMQSCCFLSTPISFIISKNIQCICWRKHQGSSWKGLQFYISVVTSLVFDQVHVFFFFLHCIVFKVRLKTNCQTSRIYLQALGLYEEKKIQMIIVTSLVTIIIIKGLRKPLKSAQSEEPSLILLVDVSWQ